MNCNAVEREATITMSFDVCTEHNEARGIGGMLSSEGVHPMDVVPMGFHVLVMTIVGVLSDHPPLKEVLTRDWPEAGVLPERAQQHILALAADRLLAGLAETRAYLPRGGETHFGMLHIPREF